MYKNYILIALFAFILAGCISSKKPIYDYTKPKIDTEKQVKIEPKPDSGNTQVILSTIDILHSKCEFGDSNACNDLGATYEQIGEYENAMKFYTRACDNSIEIGCANMGMMYEKGLGVSKNPAKALDIYKTSCNNGGALGCYNLATAYRKGEIVAQDYAIAHSAYTSACEKEDVPSCANIGSMYELGQGVQKDEVKAYNIYKVACFRGFNKACPHMKRLGDKLNIK
ncbi:tetratricopeptide repeat protein [Campylobacter majalis]|uniref:tetratricopeptide repeat protein n=1 Tax=Campylobacter majalis TaxID=2790656 RepID=UPI003D68B8C8